MSATLVLGVVHFSPREPGKRAVLLYEGVGVLNIYSCDGGGGGGGVLYLDHGDNAQLILQRNRKSSRWIETQHDRVLDIFLEFN